MGRVKGWISTAIHHVDKTWPGLLCGLQIVPVWYFGVLHRYPETHLCQWISLQARRQSRRDCLCWFRRNRSPFHLGVPPKFAPKTHVDMLTLRACSYGEWQQY